MFRRFCGGCFAVLLCCALLLFCSCPVAFAANYTNMVSLSLNADGSQYVGDNSEDGYRVDYRVSSSGTEKAADGYSCTGFIPAVKGDVIRIAGVPEQSNDLSSFAMVYFFTSAFAKTNGSISMNGAEGLVTFDDGVYSFIIPNYSDIAYFRVTLIGMSSDTIITVNEEISENNPDPAPDPEPEPDPEPTPSDKFTIGTFLADVNTVFAKGIGMVGAVASTVIEYPILYLSIVIGLCGIGVALFSRLKQ